MILATIQALETYLTQKLSIPTDMFYISLPEEGFRKNAKEHNKVLVPFATMWFTKFPEIENKLDTEQYLRGYNVLTQAAGEFTHMLKRPVAPLVLDFTLRVFFSFGTYQDKVIPFMEKFIFMQRKFPKVVISIDGDDIPVWLNIRVPMTEKDPVRVFEKNSYYEFVSNFSVPALIVDSSDETEYPICLVVDDSIELKRE